MSAKTCHSQIVDSANEMCLRTRSASVPLDVPSSNLQDQVASQAATQDGHDKDRIYSQGERGADDALLLFIKNLDSLPTDRALRQT